MRKSVFDFVLIDDTKFDKDTRVIAPKFVFTNYPPKDVMIRGKEVYAVYNEETGRWIREDEGEATSYIIKTIDNEMRKIADEYKETGGKVRVAWMWDADSGSVDKFIKFINRQCPQNSFYQLNQQIFSSGAVTTREDYISMTLPYEIAPGSTTAFHKMFDTFFEPKELEKLMWGIGVPLSGEMEDVEKFIVIKGSPGTGKGTFLDLVQDMFTVSKKKRKEKVGFWAPVDFKEMGNSKSGFPLESFKNFPLVGIQFDGDLSKMDENTIINQIVSHETVEMNLKNKPKFSATFNTFLFMGSNKAVKITDGDSGITRRVIDVSPTGDKLPPKEYKRLKEQLKYEHGAIAYECLQVFKKLGPNHYDDYIPIAMLAATNDFYDFMVSKYDEYAKRDAATQDEVWKAWSEYREFAGANKMQYRDIGAELRAYFREYYERKTIDGVRVRKFFSGFRTEKFQQLKGENSNEVVEEHNEGSGICSRDVGDSGDHRNESDLPGSDEETGSDSGRREVIGDGWLIFKKQPSIFDREYADYPAQYETEYKGNLQPEKRWANTTTKLKDLDTSRTHYVLGPSSLIFIDFDKKDETGKKSFELNKAAAESLPQTYAELSKSGGGIHLYYIYKGDVSELSNMFGDQIEIKTCPEGKKSPIRRMLTLCNDIPIAVITSGLPKKGGKKKLVNWEGIKDEKHLRNIVNQCLRREGGFGPSTSENIQMIKKKTDEAYESGMHYDISDLKSQLLVFANGSTHQKDKCIQLVDEMHLQSDEPAPPGDETQAVDDRPIILDIEVFRPDGPTNNEGLFLVEWKYIDAPFDSVIPMINPNPWEAQELFNYKIAGYNIREYDMPMLVGRSMGDGNSRSYDRSYRMINLNDKSAKPRGSENVGWLDIYEVWKAAGQGMSLKKIEIMLSRLARKSDAELEEMHLDQNQIKAVKMFRGIVKHKEVGIPWDQPAPKERWQEIIDYCKNDVLATEAAYWYGQTYINARKFQVNLVKALHPECPAALIDTANTLTKRAIFGNVKEPQKDFNYRNLAEPVGSDRYEEYLQKFGPDYKFRVWNNEGLPEYRDYIPGEVLPEGWSILPFFPGYTFDPYAKKAEKSTFHGDHGGEGGRTYSVPGMYVNVWDGDIASQYPHSIIAEVLFGPVYTKIFKEIVDARLAIKHKDFETAGKLLNGALKAFLSADTSKDLAQALKIIINAVYGLTSAPFKNEFKDPKNIDNIVAKRGNLFMLVLKEQIEARGYSVCHIKTDSIKIPDADENIKNFVIDFGKEYGYSFETEGEFDKFVLLNDAAYVAHDKNTNEWVTKAKQFQEPYVRKALFTKEPINFDDLVQTFSVSSDSALYLDMNEGYPDTSWAEKEIAMLQKKIQKGAIAKGYSSIEDMEERIRLDTEEIPKGHNYKFIGRVGSFVPVKDGWNGGYLYRGKNGTYGFASGSSGYRWLESEDVRDIQTNDTIDMSFYTHLADQAIDDISKYVDFDWFVNGEVKKIPLKEPFVSVETLPLPDEPFMNIPIGADDELPWDV